MPLGAQQPRSATAGAAAAAIDNDPHHSTSSTMHQAPVLHTSPR